MKDCKDCKFLKGTECHHETATTHYNAKTHRNNYPTKEPDCGKEAKFFEPVAKKPPYLKLGEVIEGLCGLYGKGLDKLFLDKDIAKEEALKAFKEKLDKESESIESKYPHLLNKDGNLMSKQELEAYNTKPLSKREIILAIWAYVHELNRDNYQMGMIDKTSHSTSNEQFKEYHENEKRVKKQLEDFLKEHIKVPE